MRLGEQSADGRAVFNALSMEPETQGEPDRADLGWRSAFAPRVIEVSPGAALSTFAGPNALNRSERAIFKGGVLICLTFSGLRGSRVGRREIDIRGEGSCVALISPQPIPVTSIATSQETRKTVAAYLSSEALERFGVGLVAAPRDRNERIYSYDVSATAQSLAHDLLRPESLPQVRRLRSEALVLELLAGLEQQLDGPGAKTMVEQSAGQATPAVHRARDLIAADPAADHTLCSIASTAGLSVSSLKRDFQRAFEVSPIAFLREQRLQLGRTLIERDGFSVSSAAYACGYDHPGNFAQAFRRRFGFAPSQLRR